MENGEGDLVSASSSTKRLNINLPAEAYEVLQMLALDSGQSMTQVVRSGLGLAKLAREEIKNDRSLAIVDRDGKVLKEIVVL
jgi:hypothetical protein